LVAVRQADLEAPWVQGFVAASRAGWVGYLQDPAKANGELAKLNPNLSAEMLSCITEAQSSYVRGTDGVGVMTEARWNELARALTAVGQTVSAKGAWSSK
jgi:NitT/TauT family transport system substrate-binding protein